MPLIIAIASGKGGVGKSIVAANLAHILSKHGKKTILVDLDCGAANAHTIIGIKNSFSGIGQFIYSENRKLGEFITDLGIPNFSLIQGDGLLPGTANLSFLKKKKLLKEINELDADYVVLDLGAGTQFNTIDFFLASHLGFIVGIPEPTSMLNAYAFIKTCLFRLYCQVGGPKSEARALVSEFFTGKMEELGKKGIDELRARIEEKDSKAFQKLSQINFSPKIIINQVRDARDVELTARLRQVSSKQLGLGIEYIALLNFDDAIRKSVIDRKLITLSQPSITFCKQLESIASKIVNDALNIHSPPIEDFSDLEKLFDGLGSE